MASADANGVELERAPGGHSAPVPPASPARGRATRLLGLSAWLALWAVAGLASPAAAAPAGGHAPARLSAVGPSCALDGAVPGRAETGSALGIVLADGTQLESLPVDRPVSPGLEGQETKDPKDPDSAAVVRLAPAPLPELLIAIYGRARASTRGISPYAALAFPRGPPRARA